MQFRDGSATRTADSKRDAQLARQRDYSEAVVAADREVCHCKYPKLPAGAILAPGILDEEVLLASSCQRCGGEFAL